MNDSRCHRSANALLPWYLNGTLARDEENFVRDHVEGCDACSTELDDLRITARAVSHHGVPDAPARSAARRAPISRGARLAYAAAVVLAVPAVLGLYWIFLGFPTARPGTRPAIRSSVVVDLGAGPTRAGAELPSLSLPAGTETVVLSFVVPAPGTGRRVIEVTGPDGALLARQEAAAAPDPIGRYSYAIGADVLRRTGSFEVVVTETDQQGERRQYRYPFRIEIAGASR